ncbi:hypothetical protein ACI2OX_04075 [Bacillus sp. N9]
MTNNFVKGSKEERAEEVAKVEAGIQVAKRLETRIVRVFAVIYMKITRTRMDGIGLLKD